jgi:hypothetical protein
MWDGNSFFFPFPTWGYPNPTQTRFVVDTKVWATDDKTGGLKATLVSLTMNGRFQWHVLKFGPVLIVLCDLLHSNVMMQR